MLQHILKHLFAPQLNKGKDVGKALTNSWNQSINIFLARELSHDEHGAFVSCSDKRLNISEPVSQQVL